MEWVVTTGRTLEEATDAALDELGVEVDELDIEVLEEPRPGLFGRVRGEAKIRARIKPTTPRPKVDRRDRRRRNGGGNKASDSSSGDTKGAEPAKGTKGKGRTPRSADAAEKAEPGSSALASTDVADPVTAEVDQHRPPDPGEPVEAAGPADGESSEKDGDLSPARTDAPRRRRGGRGAKRATPAGAEGSAEEGEAMSAVSVEEQVTVMQEFLEGLLDAFDLDGEVSVEAIDDETSELQIEGDDLGLLIGPKGQTLTSIQDLARTVAQRKLPGAHEGRVRVDVSGYRKRRRAALERFARQVADDVRASGAQKVLEPMNAADRKVVHDVINDIDGVTTTSEGEDPRRRVVVLPAD